MILKSVLVVIAILFLFACNENNELTSAKKNTKELILGKWESKDGHSIEFKNDNSFKEIYYLYDSSDGEVKTEARFVRIGIFDINSEILNMHHFFYSDVEAIDGFRKWRDYRNYYKIRIVDQQMLLNPVGIFESLEKNNKEFWGRWREKIWYCEYDANSNEVFKNGEMYMDYNFVKGKNTYSIDYFYMNDLNEKYFQEVEFRYLEPYLDFVFTEEKNDVVIDYDGEKMIWEMRKPSLVLDKN